MQRAGTQKIFKLQENSGDHLVPPYSKQGLPSKLGPVSKSAQLAQCPVKLHSDYLQG